MECREGPRGRPGPSSEEEVRSKERRGKYRTWSRIGFRLSNRRIFQDGLFRLFFARQARSPGRRRGRRRRRSPQASSSSSSRNQLHPILVFPEAQGASVGHFGRGRRQQEEQERHHLAMICQIQLAVSGRHLYLLLLDERGDVLKLMNSLKYA